MGTPVPPRGAPPPDGAAPPSIRSLTLTVYAPTFVFAVGQGAVIPIMALAARSVGAGVALAGLIVALRGIGTMLFDIPAGRLITRLGERRAMVIATVVLIVSLVGCAVSTSPVTFAVSAFVMGCGWAIWLLARLTYVTEVMPPNLRGRALSTLGGVNRIGNFVGPLVGALAIGVAGLDGAFYTHIVVAVAGYALLLAIPDPHTGAPPELEPHDLRVKTTVRDHRHVFATAGVAALAIGALQRVASGGTAAVGRPHRPRRRERGARLRHLGGDGHDAVLPGRVRHGPLGPQVRGDPVPDHPRGRTAAGAAHPRVLVARPRRRAPRVRQRHGQRHRDDARRRLLARGTRRTSSGCGASRRRGHGGRAVARRRARRHPHLGAASVAIGAVGLAGAARVALRMPEPLHRLRAHEEDRTADPAESPG